MKTLRDTWLLFARKVVETIRNPIYIVASLTNPVLYLVLFAPLLSKLALPGANQGNIMNEFVPGMVVITAFMEGLFVGYDMIDEVRNGVIERLRVTPTSRFALLAGRVLRDMVNMLVIVNFFMLIAIPFGFKLHLVGYLVLQYLLCLVLITTSSFGNALGLIMKDENRISPIIQFVNLPVLLLSGMLLPMELAPAWLQNVAHINPLYYAVEAGRLLSEGIIWDAKVGEAVVILTALTAITTAWATRVFSRDIA